MCCDGIGFIMSPTFELLWNSRTNEHSCYYRGATASPSSLALRRNHFIGSNSFHRLQYSRLVVIQMSYTS